MFLQEVAHGPTFFYLAPGIVLFPLLGLLINILIGHRLGEKAIGAIASLASGAAFVVAVLLAISLGADSHGAVVPFAPWIHIGELELNWAFQVDTLSVTMMLVVSGVGTLIHIYSIGYMHEDVRHNGDPGRFRRFFVYLNLFIAAMMILVGADNYMMLFVGWEGVGLCSYLLIGFWYDKGKDGIGNAIAAKKAFVTNRVGDFGFLLAAMTMFWYFRSFEFHTVFERAPEIAAMAPGAILAITLFMLVGVTGKSAQLPLYVWLPDAMAGPTPVSALIHAATMVTAGVYLVARSADLYMLVPQAQNIVAWVGALTALFAATIAVGQFDIKKVLAYSTISQLGFMVAAVGMGAFTAGMFHLVTHAFFKALLFLGAGSVILGMEAGEHHVAHDPNLKKHAKAKLVSPGHHDFDPQDMRNMGGLKDRMRTTYWVYIIGALALAGVPPLAGFWSKDEILAEAVHLHYLPVYILLSLAAFLTAFYMARQVFMVFYGKPRSLAAEHAPENPPVVTVPLIILAVLSALAGFMNLPFPEQGLGQFGTWLEHTNEAAFKHGEFNAVTAGIAILVALAGIGLGWVLYYRRYPAFLAEPPARRVDDPMRSYIGGVYQWLKDKWYVDELYDLLIIRPYKALAAFLADVIDWRFWHDWFHDTVIAGGYQLLARGLSGTFDLKVIDGIANGLGASTQGIARSMRTIQTGYVRNYALSVFLGLVIILGYLILRIQ